MDGTRFDMLARHLSTIRTRRESVKAAAVAGLGLGLAGLGLHGAEAKKKRRKKRCKKLLRGCNPGGKRKCCNDLVCKDRGDEGFLCCKDIGDDCANDEECCTSICNPAGKCDIPIVLP